MPRQAQFPFKNIQSLIGLALATVCQKKFDAKTSLSPYNPSIHFFCGGAPL